MHCSCCYLLTPRFHYFDYLPLDERLRQHMALRHAIEMPLTPHAMPRLLRRRFMLMPSPAALLLRR